MKALMEDLDDSKMVDLQTLYTNVITEQTFVFALERVDDEDEEEHQHRRGHWEQDRRSAEGPNKKRQCGNKKHGRFVLQNVSVAHGPGPC